MNETCTDIDIAAVRQKLAEPSWRLTFPPALEAEFDHELRNTEQRSTRFIALFLLLLWTVYLLIDAWRWQFMAGTVHAQAFILGVFTPRVVVLLCFIWVCWLLNRPDTAGRLRTRALAILVVACSTAIAMTSYTLRNVGLHETSSVLLLTVVITFYPLGITLRTMLPVALLVCAVCAVAGPLLLQNPADMLQHWVTMGAMLLTTLLSAVTAYYRERAKREQFLLRKLLKWEASHDPLTGLGNRRLFNDLFQRHLGHAGREQQQLFLAILDIDHFKLYNDHYGHQAGDEVLKQVAKLLSEHLRRPLDVALRLGGEEFALLLPAQQPQACIAYVQRIVSAFAQLHLEHAASPTAAYVSVSIGLAQQQEGDSMDSMFSRADDLLYQAKQQGRNRLCVDATVAHQLEVGERSAG